MSGGSIITGHALLAPAAPGGDRPVAASCDRVAQAPDGPEAAPKAPRPRAVRRPPVSRPAELLLVAASLLWLPQAALLSYAVGDIASGAGASAVLWPALGIALIGLLKAGLETAGSRLAHRAARRVLSDMRERAVTALAARSPLDTMRPASGLAASVLAEQAEAIVPYLSRFRPARLRATVVPLAIVLCVLPFSWVGAVVLLVSAPVIPLFMALIGWRAKAASEKQLVEMGQMNAFLLDRLRGLATIRSLDAVEATALRVRADADSLRRRTMAVLRIAFLSSAVLELFAALGVALMAVYIGFHLLGELPFGAWGDKLTLAEGLFLLLLAPAFFEPLRELSAVWHDRASGEAALDALQALETGGPELPGASAPAFDAPAAPGAAPAVTISGLGYRHAGKTEPVFSGLGLSVAAGEHVALLAPSGCGKSTLLALIAGLAAPETGRIAIGETALTNESAGGLRRRIGWIGQNPHILAGTLNANVRLGRPWIDGAMAADALDTMRLGPLRQRRGSAVIGEAGLGLSGGETLRLALARVAATPEAGLILADEPTAHLDATTAQEITEALLLLARGRTLIVATHDPALAARMDRVIRLSSIGTEIAA